MKSPSNSPPSESVVLARQMPRVWVALAISVIVMSGALIGIYSHFSSSPTSDEVTLGQFSERLEKLSSRSRLLLAHLFAAHSMEMNLPPRQMESCMEGIFQGESEEWEDCAPLERKKMRASAELFDEILIYVENFGESHEGFSRPGGNRRPAREVHPAFESSDSQSIDSLEEPSQSDDPQEKRPDSPKTKPPFWQRYSDEDAIEA